MTPRPLHILVCSSSKTTLAFLNTMFSGFDVTLKSSIQDTKEHLQANKNSTSLLDFIILDDQSESHVEDLYAFFHSLDSPALRAVTLIHLYTPTASATGYAVFDSTTPGVVKMTKPPRTARIFQMLAGLKDLPNTVTLAPHQSTDVSKAMEDLAVAQRTLFGNVLIAEGRNIRLLLYWAHYPEYR